MRRQQDLSVLLFHQPLAKPVGEVLRSTRIERLIEIIDGKEARRFGMEGEYGIEQQVQDAFTGIVTGEQVTFFIHVSVAKAQTSLWLRNAL